MYANNEYSEQVMAGSGGYGRSPFGPALEPQPEPESQPISQAEPVTQPEPGSEAGPADAGLLMSFLTDFRTAEYEEVRRKRMEELEKSKKGKAHRPVAQVEQVEQEVEPSWDDTYGQTRTEWDPPVAPPETHDLGVTPPGTSYPVSDADFQVAACKPEEPTGKRRFPLGLPSLKGFGQSPATA